MRLRQSNGEVLFENKQPEKYIATKNSVREDRKPQILSTTDLMTPKRNRIIDLVFCWERDDLGRFLFHHHHPLLSHHPLFRFIGARMRFLFLCLSPYTAAKCERRFSEELDSDFSVGVPGGRGRGLIDNS